MHLETSSVSSNQTTMSVRSESKEAIHLKAEQIREQQRNKDDLAEMKQRGLFAKRDKREVSTRRLAIADHLDDIIYGDPPPPPPPRRGLTPLANVKTVEPAKIDDSARSLISEETLDASARTADIDASSSAVKKTSKPKSPVRTKKSPKTKSRKTRSNSIDSDAGSVMSTITEKSSKKKKHSSSRSLSSKASKKSSKKSPKTKTKKKTSGKARRRASTKSVATCESIDELTVTSGEMSFDGLTLDSSTAADETDTHDLPASVRSARSIATHDETGKAQREKKTKTKRRSSTGALSTTKKKSSKKKQGKDSKDEPVPIIIASGSNDDDDDEDGKEPSLVESTLSGGDANGAEVQESAVLSQGLQALADYQE